VRSGADNGGIGGPRPLRNLRNFLSLIAWISSVKYRRCSGRRVLLVGYLSRVNSLIQSPSYTAATETECMVYMCGGIVYTFRQDSVIAGEFERLKLSRLLTVLRSVTHTLLFPHVLSCSSPFRWRRLQLTILSEMYDGQIACPRFGPDEWPRKSRGWTGQKEAASEIHSLTNLRLSADGFSLCMPTIIAQWINGIIMDGALFSFTVGPTVLVGTSSVSNFWLK